MEIEIKNILNRLEKCLDKIVWRVESDYDGDGGHTYYEGLFNNKSILISLGESTEPSIAVVCLRTNKYVSINITEPNQIEQIQNLTKEIDKLNPYTSLWGEVGSELSALAYPPINLHELFPEIML